MNTRKARLIRIPVELDERLVKKALDEWLNVNEAVCIAVAAWAGVPAPTIACPRPDVASIDVEASATQHS